MLGEIGGHIAPIAVGLTAFRFVEIVHRQVESVESDGLHDSVPQIKPSVYTFMYTLERKN